MLKGENEAFLKHTKSAISSSTTKLSFSLLDSALQFHIAHLKATHQGPSSHPLVLLWSCITICSPEYDLCTLSTSNLPHLFQVFHSCHQALLLWVLRQPVTTWPPARKLLTSETPSQMKKLKSMESQHLFPDQMGSVWWGRSWFCVPGGCPKRIPLNSKLPLCLCAKNQQSLSKRLSLLIYLQGFAFCCPAFLSFGWKCSASYLGAPVSPAGWK